MKKLLLPFLTAATLFCACSKEDDGFSADTKSALKVLNGSFAYTNEKTGKVEREITFNPFDKPVGKTVESSEGKTSELKTVGKLDVKKDGNTKTYYFSIITTNTPTTQQGTILRYTIINENLLKLSPVDMSFSYKIKDNNTIELIDDSEYSQTKRIYIRQ